jgi:chromosomal replication initiation ATPase DnaA
LLLAVIDLSLYNVLVEADEKMTRQFAYKSKGIILDHLQQAVAALIGIEPEELAGASKARKATKGRALFCYLAVQEMGLSMTEVAKRLKIALPTVSGAVPKGKQVVRVEDIVNLLNANM